MSDLTMDIDPSVQDALRELMQDDYPLLLETFSRDARTRLARLRVSLKARDWDDFRQTAHSFKGSCGNMGATALHDACEAAEQAALAGDAEAAQHSYERIEQSFQRVAPLLGI